MSYSQADVVICGAGIAGISAAYHLTVRSGVRNVVLVDDRPPLTLTSDKSTECYRNFWPGPGDAMVSLMNRSIDILEELSRESDDFFRLSRRGYLFATADPSRISEFERAAQEGSDLGAGPVRYHTGQSAGPEYVPAPPQGFQKQLTGSDLILDRATIRKHFPYFSKDTVAVLHARRCGWFSAQQMGMYLLERARAHGLRFLRGRMGAVEVSANRVRSVRLDQDGKPVTLKTRSLVIAAGPFLKEAGQMVEIDLPVFSELHIKVAFKDSLRVVPRDAPLLIWTDPVRLPWSEDEKRTLTDLAETKWLLDEFPSGVHARPEGGPDSDVLLVLWTYDTAPREPVFPFTVEPHHAEVSLRGLAKMIPGLEIYFGRASKPVVDGGYYTKTVENRPLIGPLPIQGSYVIAALSGFGLMASCAAGELVAAHVTGKTLPRYAAAFDLKRYQDPEYRKLLESWNQSGQL